MTGQSPSGEHWLRTELNNIVSDIPLDLDCNTIDHQLCRDLFTESKTIPFEELAMDPLRLRLYGSFGIDGDRNLHYEHDLDDLELQPIECTALGALCELTGKVNEFDEQEYMLLSGSVFTVNPEQLFTETLNIISGDDWPESRDAKIIEAELNERPILFYPQGIAFGAHVAFRIVYSAQEIHNLKTSDPNYDPLDFTAISGRKLGLDLGLAVTNYVHVSPSVLVGAFAEEDSGVNRQILG